MKKVSTVATRQSRNISQQKLTIGLDVFGKIEIRREIAFATNRIAHPAFARIGVIKSCPRFADILEAKGAFTDPP